MLPHLLCNHLLFHIFLYIILHFFVEILFLINFRLWYEGILKYLGESVTGVESGSQDSVTVCAWLIGGKIGWGCWQMCRHVGMTLLHMHKASPTLKEEADGCDVLRWCHYHSTYVNVERVFKEVCTRPDRVQFICAVSSRSFGLFPGWLVQKATDPLTWLPWCLSGSEIIRQGSVLYLFNHMYSRLSWVPSFTVP